VDSKELYNSGILGPGQSATFTFPTPGEYTYVCIVHAPQGMFGKVIVEGVAPLPASLPRTGGGGSLSVPFLAALGLLAAGALLLLGVRRRWRT
jgi:hypothetical protein